MIKTRFAVSPTGFLHIGGLRAALFQYLFAKSQGGTILLRIEDTDRERFVEGAVENLLHSLDWAGIKFDEGVVLDNSSNIVQNGDNGPYIQSERLKIYQEHIKTLLDSNKAYKCYCTKERLDELRKSQELNKQPTGYDGKCRDLNGSNTNDPFIIRLKVPEEGITEFQDKIRGKVSFDNKLIDDQVLIKADGFPTYHFAVVVDDHLMGVTDVIRGDEWVSSTPKHILLYSAFDWPAPNYAHIPLLINEKKQKLSKRHGDVSVEDFKEKGYLPEALINFIALLGWNTGDDREIFSLQELEKEFNIEQVGKAAAVFDRTKLDWYNKQYIMKLDTNSLADRAIPFFVNTGVVKGSGEMGKWGNEGIDLKKIVKLEQGRASTLVELVENVGFVFADELNYEPELLVWKKSTREDAKDKLEELLQILELIPEEGWNQENLQKMVFDWIKEKSYSTGDVLWPMRVTLSGQKNSPGPFEIANVLGKNNTISKMKHGISIL
jgi:nondiscriminating glutamyl-tRNA synthetase